MTDATLSLLTQCLFAIAGFASLCLASPRQGHLRLLDKPARTRRTPLQWSGWLMLILAAATAVVTQRWGQGLVELCGALTLAAFAVIAAATYRPKCLVPMMWSGAVLGLLFTVWLYSA